MTKKTLPEPECRFGFTASQVEEIMGSRFDEFTGWMYGQTMSICDGTLWDYAQKKAVPSDCGRAHGTVIYRWDVERFLIGLPVVD